MTSSRRAILVLCFLVSAERSRSFVDTASLEHRHNSDRVGSDNSPDETPHFADDTVKELENLKNSVGSTLEMMKTHSETYSNINGQQKERTEIKETLNQNGKVIASIDQDLEQASGADGKPEGRVRTKVDIPSKGIHKTMVSKLPEQKAKDKEKEEAKEIMEPATRRASPSLEDIQIDNNGSPRLQEKPYGGIPYSPLDMAEYVFWTNDEKGVTLAIEDYLQEGAMTREEAIAFLQDIKINLDYLQYRYNQLGLKSNDILGEKDISTNNPYLAQLKPTNKPINTNPNPFETPYTLNFEKKNLEIIPEYSTDVQKQILDANREEEEYGELLERLRVADFLYTEYSLEEVIYQLAKVMFTQSLTRGSAEAQQALRKFTSFLESESSQGRISKALEKKVLDVLIAALTDTLNEHPELQDQQAPNPSPIDQQAVMGEILKFNAKQRPFANLAKIDGLQLRMARGKGFDPLGLGKYKGP